MTENPHTLDGLKAAILGRWESLSVELRPTEDRNGTGAIAPTYLTRVFTYAPDDRFAGTIRMFGDGLGQLELLEFEFAGQLRWGGPHPVAHGAFAVDYVLDEEFAVTPLSPMAAELLNTGRPADVAQFEAGHRATILGQAFPLFGIEAGQTVVDYDLLYLAHGLLFFGAKHVDGTPFDRPERRPHQLQIPLARAA